MLKVFDTVRGGKLANRGLCVKEWLEKSEGKKVVITLQSGARRSTRQNAYYWGVVIPAVAGVFKAYGDDVTPDAVHCYLKEHVAGMVDVLTLPDGSRKAIVRTSTNLTTAEWEDYILKVRAWGGQWGVDFPEPNEI